MYYEELQQHVRSIKSVRLAEAGGSNGSIAADVVGYGCCRRMIDWLELCEDVVDVNILHIDSIVEDVAVVLRSL